MLPEPRATARSDELPAAPADDEGAERVASIQERLEWLMLFRVVLVTLLLASAIAVNLSDVTSYSGPAYIAMASLVVGTYLATIAHVVALRRGVDRVRLAYAQLVGDVILVFGLVLLTEGVESVFSFLFFLTIFNGAVVLRRPGAVFAATATSLALTAVALLQFSELPWLVRTFPAIVPRSPQVPVYAMTVHLVGFYAVALLSGYLADQLGRVGTALARRQLDLRELRALTENVVRSAGSGLVALDEQGRLLFGNPAAQRILGVELAGQTGRTLAMINPSLARLGAATGDRTDPVELPWETPDRGARRTLSLQRSDLLDATGSASGSILVIHDQTEVRELQDQLARQAHLAAIGNLSAAIAHEIRNPLAAISGSVELLRGDVPQESSAAMLVEIVLREVDRLNKLVTDFLNYARPQSLAARATDLRELVRGTLDSFLQDTTLVGETFEVEVVDALGDTGPVEVDADRLRQVLWNLLRNAAEANRGEGVVRVGLVHRANPASEDTVTIVVHDEGPGFSEEALGQIFEPFFTTKEGGTGLGLATCHRIVHAHDGALRAGNLPGRGAALSIVLPVGEGVDRGGLSDVRAVEESDYATERVRSAEPSERRKRQR